jgi:hypothetical protein
MNEETLIIIYVGKFYVKLSSYKTKRANVSELLCYAYIFKQVIFNNGQWSSQHM